jgi:hypothetical protein
MYRYIYLFSRYIPSCQTSGSKGDVHMKKILFIGLVLLALLIVMPAAVSAAETDSDAVTVSGSIGLAIDVSVTPAAIPFDTMTAGVDETGSTVVKVTTTSSSWTVTATDQKANNKGYMTTVSDGTGKKLASMLNFGKSASPSGNLPDATFMTGLAPVKDQLETAYVKQSIAAADSDGAYSIVITFTGTAN